MTRPFSRSTPNGKIPALYDPDGPSGRPLALFESGAILLYLADEAGQFIWGARGRAERLVPLPD